MLQQLIPNVIEYFPELLKALRETLIMVSISGIFAALIGCPVGVALLVTSEGHIMENSVVY